MSYMCPLCNGMSFETYMCPHCQGKMDDRGRLMDLFDDYSPYLEIDGMKKDDGLPSDLQNHQCPHIFACSKCGNESIQIMNEIYIP